ncbi:MAG: hypothetical protein WC976_05860 [Caldisericia bacterium]
MKYIGIDGGLDGGVVLIESGSAGGEGPLCKIAGKHITPTIAGKKSKREYNVPEMVNILKQCPPESSFVILEFAQSMPKQGVVSSTKIGRGFGLWEGIIAALGIPYAIVHPRTWQKEMLTDMNKKDTKQASAIIAHRLFPTENFKKSEKCKKDHSGLTDACLLGVYGYKIHGAIGKMVEK